MTNVNFTLFLVSKIVINHFYIKQSFYHEIDHHDVYVHVHCHTHPGEGEMAEPNMPAQKLALRVSQQMMWTRTQSSILHHHIMQGRRQRGRQRARVLFGALTEQKRVMRDVNLSTIVKTNPECLIQRDVENDTRALAIILVKKNPTTKDGSLPTSLTKNFIKLKISKEARPRLGVKESINLRQK